MKLKSLLITLGLSLTVGVGAAVALTANKAEVKETEASQYKDGAVYYFIPSDSWAADSATFKCNYYNSSWGNDSWIGVETPDATYTYCGRTVYRFTIPHSDRGWHDQIQILRFVGSSENGYSGNIATHDSYWRGSSDSNYDTLIMDKEFAPTSGWTTSTVVNNRKASWMNTSKVFDMTYEISPSLSTTRVFFYNSGTHWASNAQCAIYAWGGDAVKEMWDVKPDTDGTYYNLSWFQDDNEGAYWYGYADIPVNVDGFKIVAITAADDRDASDSYWADNNLWFGNDGAQNSVLYGSTDGNAISIGSAHNKQCGAKLMKKVLEAIDTCEEGTYNGYYSYYNVNANFYSFVTDDDHKAETVTTLNGNSASILTHMTALEYRDTYGVSGSSRILVDMLRGTSGTSASSTMTIVIAAALSIAAIGGYFYLRTRKED